MQRVSLLRDLAEAPKTWDSPLVSLLTDFVIYLQQNFYTPNILRFDRHSIIYFLIFKHFLHLICYELNVPKFNRTQHNLIKQFYWTIDLFCNAANFPLEIVRNLPPEIITGIYYGWASVDNCEVYKMVMSIGMNPFYDNKERSMVCVIVVKNYHSNMYKYHNLSLH